ncbi:MAG TPA: cysteine hydrolase family protein, partial [Candidatus Obscuribacterales bacterium]
MSKMIGEKHKTVFVDIDTQFDFMNPEGGLYVPGAESLDGNLRRLLAYAGSHDIPVLASADAHAPDDPEFQVFPPHCVKGTPGQLRVDATADPQAKVIANSPQELDLTGTRSVVLEKT